MGMTATYQLVDNEKLALLKNTDTEWQELFEELEDLEDEAAVCLDIDKMWDVLHFVLTGKSAENPLKGNLLSESIVGTMPFRTATDTPLISNPPKSMKSSQLWKAST